MSRSSSDSRPKGDARCRSGHVVAYSPQLASRWYCRWRPWRVRTRTARPSPSLLPVAVSVLGMATATRTSRRSLSVTQPARQARRSRRSMAICPAGAVARRSSIGARSNTTQGSPAKAATARCNGLTFRTRDLRSCRSFCWNCVILILNTSLRRRCLPKLLVCHGCCGDIREEWPMRWRSRSIATAPAARLQRPSRRPQQPHPGRRSTRRCRPHQPFPSSVIPEWSVC